MIGNIAILALLCGVVLADQRADQYIDNALQTGIQNALRSVGLDPAPLPDFTLTFGVQNIYNKQGEAVFTSGTLTHLERIRRAGNCAGPLLIRGEVSINCTLRLSQLITEYKVLIRNDSAVYQPRNMGHIAETSVHVSIAGQPGSGRVKDLTVISIGQITPTFSGVPGPFNIYLKVLQDGYRQHISGSLNNILVYSGKFRDALNRALQNKPMPRP